MSDLFERIMGDECLKLAEAITVFDRPLMSLTRDEAIALLAAELHAKRATLAQQSRDLATFDAAVDLYAHHGG